MSLLRPAATEMGGGFIVNATEFDRIAAELEAQGWHWEAALLRRFPRTAWEDELLKGMFVAATNVRDAKRAEKIAHRMLQFAPDNPFAHLALCLVRLRQGKVEEAAQAFDRACHFASSLPIHFSRKVHLLCLQGKTDEARQVVRAAWKEFADRWEVQRARAHVWLSLGRRERALQTLQHLVRNRPNDAISNALLAQGLFQTGQYAAARKQLRKMAKHLPTLTFTDMEAFLAHALAKQAVSLWQRWLRPSWWWEQIWLRWLPPRYFFAIGAFWGTIAVLLALLKLTLPTNWFVLIVTVVSLAFVYERFAPLIVLWWLRR